MQFVFDRDFDTDIETVPRPGTARAGAIYTKEEYDAAIAAARADGYNDGRMAGRTEALTSTADSEAERQIAALEAIGPHLARLFDDADRHHAVLEAQMLQFVLSVFERVAPDVAKALAIGQAEREAGEAIRMALGSAALRLHLPPDVVRASGEEIQRRARLSGFGGRVEIATDPSLVVGDLRAEWDHGVLTYSFNDICKRILDALGSAQARAEAGTRPAETED